MVIGFWKRNDEYGCCSNWYPASITIDGKTFSCCEQYMMYQKAILFNDHEIADKIINTTTPKDIKALGRQLKILILSLGTNIKKWLLVLL